MATEALKVKDQRMISWSVALAAVAAAAASRSSAATPTRAQVDAAERAIGGELAWPAGAQPIASYDRHYFIDTPDRSVLRAQFRVAPKPSAGQVFLDPDGRGYVMDGGCSIVNLIYYGAGDSRNRLMCGGR